MLKHKQYILLRCPVIDRILFLSGNRTWISYRRPAEEPRDVQEEPAGAEIRLKANFTVCFYLETVAVVLWCSKAPECGKKAEQTPGQIVSFAGGLFRYFTFVKLFPAAAKIMATINTSFLHFCPSRSETHQRFVSGR